MKVGVIMGGISSEREISLLTGKEMLAHLNPDKYEGIGIDIKRPDELFDKIKEIDFALLALHGTYGEDGTIQAALESMGIPYSGSGVLSSGLCMDKNLSKRLLQAEGVPTPEWIYWDGMENYSSEAVNRLGFPVFVKPNSGGSSVGTLPAKDEADFQPALQEALRWDSSVVIEKYIEGDEITCPILGGELLPIIGIRSNNSTWFDYNAKYQSGGADEQVITLPPETEASVRAAALSSYRMLKCSVYARVDMILRDGIPYVLEVNTLPGMTPASLMPKSAQAAGMTFSGLLDRIIELSLQERDCNRKLNPQRIVAGSEGVRL
ncbi:D-alanine--D-alanine ligase [Fontibacillus phaseoli]|uniref:D-alanine--D-alanine ligase n=1 Tax=Fontibacillus phaseoli TaxID=1416533 RepID=A0A369BQI9_9BACL|nr:D-alanine--D-alanine ligase [Fontibacillus phaseoli]RCX23823.1 D-alanine--D-alanine ligase [Fontibacillus phaseoli]